MYDDEVAPVILVYAPLFIEDCHCMEAPDVCPVKDKVVGNGEQSVAEGEDIVPAVSEFNITETGAAELQEPLVTIAL